MASPLSSALGERLHHNIDAGFSGRAAAVRLGIQLRLDQARRVRSGSAAGESY